MFTRLSGMRPRIAIIRPFPPMGRHIILLRVYNWARWLLTLIWMVREQVDKEMIQMGLMMKTAFLQIPGGSSTSVTNYTVTIATANSTGTTANLCGWIDWNGNGTFDASEAVCTTVASGITSATLTWPSATLGGSLGTTGVYARFRITTDALTGSNPTGIASNGEVEDYFIPFLTPLPVTLLFIHCNRFACRFCAQLGNCDRNQYESL